MQASAGWFSASSHVPTLQLQAASACLTQSVPRGEVAPFVAAQNTSDWNLSRYDQPVQEPAPQTRYHTQPHSAIVHVALALRVRL